MSSRGTATIHCLGWCLAILSTAPAPADAERNRTLSDLGEARYQASLKHFDEAWVYYQQSRSDSMPLYFWSRLVLEAQGDLSERKSDRLAAFQAHLDRMIRLETLVKKVRRIGFGQSIDVTAVNYFRIEAEFWLARGKSQAKPTVPPSF